MASVGAGRRQGEGVQVWAPVEEAEGRAGRSAIGAPLRSSRGQRAGGRLALSTELRPRCSRSVAGRIRWRRRL